LPATGTIQALQEPSGPGVRIDSGMYAGLQVPLFYDPLLAKLIVWGTDRTQAIARMRRALPEYQVMGVRTTLPFARWLMEHPRFIAGDLSTDFIAEEWETRKKHEAHHGHAAHHEHATQAEKAESEKAEEMPGPPQLAALVGSLLMQEQVEEEKLRRQPAGENGVETSRWRDAGRREALRRM
jgi:acetyl/propionyl-CoA carboxylase alpha subunit